MLGIIIEVLLVIYLWQKGWKWKAVLPVAIGYTFALFLGMILGASGVEGESTMLIGAFLELCMIIAMVIMCFVKVPTVANNRQPSSSQPAVD